MVTDWQIQRKGDSLILGIAIENAVLDIVSDPLLLASCVELLEAPHNGPVWTRMGQFGEFPVTLNLHDDDKASIFIDGPEFGSGRVQSAAIWVKKDRLGSILRSAMEPS
jgi:hypothetical protein